MAQQDTTPKAVAQASTDRTHFLSGLNADGFEGNTPAMGRRKVETNICVFQDAANTPVMLVMRSGGFDLHNLLSAEEARTLAAALLMAASHAEDQDNERHAADFLASQQQQAAEVPA